ncbi:MAG: hypothetical protein EA352_02665 [Gemmatimonadales bacterium]|nr:MAG: hypothetical protein EA352_02665 [Gemmatimonadales bacterium]
MKFRFGMVGLLGLGLVLGGCASGPAGNGAAAPSSEELTMGGSIDDDMPDWVEALPEGTEPVDNEYVAEALLFQSQAAQLDEEEEEEFQRLMQRTLESAQQGIESYPDNPQHYFQAGEAYFGMGDYEAAAEMFDRAEELYPRYIWETLLYRETAWVEIFNEGIDMLEAGDRDGAVANFERANELYDYRPEVMLNLASIYAEEARYEDAIEQYARAIEVIDSEWFDRVDEETQEVWSENRQIAVQNRAQLFLVTERYEEAAREYEAIIEEDPDNLQALSSLAAALVASGQSDRAESLFEDLLARDDLNAVDYFTIGVGLYQADSFAEAATAFREAWERVPEHRDNIFNLSQSLYLAEDYEQLHEFATRLVEIDSHNPIAYQLQAQAYLQHADDEAAGLAAYEQGETLPFSVTQLEIVPADGGTALVGFVTNLAGQAGQTVDLRLHFFDYEGAALGTEEVSVQLEGEAEPVQFTVRAPDDPGLFGFRYEVVD